MVISPLSKQSSKFPNRLKYCISVYIFTSFSLSVYTNIEEDIEIYILDYLEDNMPFYNFGEYETLSEGLKAFYNATERIN